MNDEIKLSKSEIIGICEFLKIHHFENSYLLLDYITNLQEENEQYKKYFKTTQDTIDNAFITRDNYKQRVDKAIEYIKSNEFHCKNQSEQEKYDYDLLKILGGDE